MNLHEALRAAVTDPPPSGIDLDELSRREKRRRHVTRWIAGVGGTAAVLVVTVAVVAALPLDRGDPYPPGAGPAQVVRASVGPEQLAAALRLTAVLRGLGPEYGVPPGTRFAVEAVEGDAVRFRYLASWTSGDVHLAVVVWRADAPLEDGCAKNGPDSTCTRVEESDGSVSYRAAETNGGSPLRQAENYRPDHTAVMVSATGGAAPLTAEQLLTVARLPGWSLAG